MEWWGRPPGQKIKAFWNRSKFWDLLITTGVSTGFGKPVGGWWICSPKGENHCINQLRKTLDEHLKDIRKPLSMPIRTRLGWMSTWRTGPTVTETCRITFMTWLPVWRMRGSRGLCFLTPWGWCHRIRYIRVWWTCRNAFHGLRSIFIRTMITALEQGMRCMQPKPESAASIARWTVLVRGRKCITGRNSGGARSAWGRAIHWGDSPFTGLEMVRTSPKRLPGIPHCRWGCVYPDQWNPWTGIEKEGCTTTQSIPNDLVETGVMPSGKWVVKPPW